MNEEGISERERGEDASTADKTTSLQGKATAASQGEVAYAALRRRIIQCELEPGERITEAQLASEIGIGKTPVREALTRLVQEGLVRSMPGHGYEVTFMLGTSDQDEPYGFDTTMRWEWLERVMEDAARRVPVLEQARIHHGWAGLYETSPDHNAILGPIPGVENLLVATGFSGHGVMQSPATGMLMSEFILDGKAHTIDVSDLGIERFSTGPLQEEKHVI